MKFINKLITATAFVLVLVPSFVLAQNESLVAEQAVMEEGTVLSEINISNAELTQEGNQASVYFLVENRGSRPQSDLHYGIEITKVGEDGGQELVDTYVLGGAKTVNPGESASEAISYDLSNLAAGEYEVWVLAQTPGGMIAGIAMAGKVVSTSTDNIEIDTLNCVLSVSGDDAEYTINQGVDVSTKEDILMSCPVINNGQVKRSIYPEFVTYERSVFGDMLTMTYPAPTVIDFMPGEEKNVEITIPKADRPQAYDLVVSFKSKTDDAVSNKAIVHYVLQGVSATVQSVKFSKDAYVAGEEIELVVLWSLAADTFLDSRSGGTQKTEDYYLDVAVTNGAGQMCGNASVLADKSDLTAVKLKSDIVCEDPTALVTIKTSSGQVLDSESVTVITGESEVVEEIATAPQFSLYWYIVVSILALFGIYLLVRYAKGRRHEAFDDTMFGLLFILSFGFGMAVNVAPAEAVTWSYSEVNEDCSVAGGDGGVCVRYNYVYATAVINSNKTTYAPGETITLSGTVRNHVCANVGYGLGANLAGSQTSLLNRVTFSGTRNVSSTVVAPSTPGNHTINLSLCVGNQRLCSSARINITVSNSGGGGGGVGSGGGGGGATSGRVNGSCRAVHYQCAAGTSQNNRDNGTNYTWTCGGANGGSTASCSETKVNGVCGTTLNTCSAGIAANGSRNSTHYTWTCNSQNGGTNASCQIPIPPSVTLTSDPTRVNPGSPSDLTWVVTNATSCTASGGWSGAKSITGGTERVNPTFSTTYTLTCAGAGGATNSTASVTLPSGSLTASGCSIPLGGTGCDSVVNWSSDNFLGAISLLHGTSTISNNPAGPITRTVTPSNRTFVLDDLGSNFMVTTNANVTCINGGIWVSSLNRCASLPSIVINADPEVIRSGESADIDVTVDSPYDLTCTLAGGVDAANSTIRHNGTSGSTRNYTVATRPLTAAQIVSITCVADIASDLSNSAETRVNVVPVIQEI